MLEWKGKAVKWSENMERWLSSRRKAGARRRAWIKIKWMDAISDDFGIEQKGQRFLILRTGHYHSCNLLWICAKKEKIVNWISVIFYTQKWLITFHRAFSHFFGYVFVSSHSNLCPIYHISFYSFVKIQLKIFSMTYLF